MEGRDEKYGSKLIKPWPVLGGWGWQLSGVRFSRSEIPNGLCFRYLFTSRTFPGLTEVEVKSLPNVLLNSGFTNRLHFFVCVWFLLSFQGWEKWGQYYSYSKQEVCLWLNHVLSVGLHLGFWSVVSTHQDRDDGNLPPKTLCITVMERRTLGSSGWVVQCHNLGVFISWGFTTELHKSWEGAFLQE